MSTAFKPYLISEFKTGISTYLQPWIRPQDAFEPLVNAYTYRGVVSKRGGMTQFGNQVPDSNPIMGLMRHINTDGTTQLLAATTVNLYKYVPGSNTFVAVTTPPTFTGNISQFFNWTNWQQTVGATAYTYMCNNKDAVTRFDGTASTQPTLTINAAAETITKCLDLQVYKQRMLYIRPTLSSNGVQNQSIYWSAVSNATDVLVDVAGHGGFLAAPTGDIIQSTEFIRDTLVVFFTNSVWAFRFTGNQTNPFVWQKLNDTTSTNCPYASVDYDQRASSIGNTGIIACDGVNVQRFDLSIIDYYENNFSQTYYGQAFSQRYDNLNQTWTLYVSDDPAVQNPLVGGVAPGSDSALIYNFLENSWATYTFSIPLTCLGLFYKVAGKTWAGYTQTWESTDVIWGSFQNQKNSPILLAGDTTGHVWLMDDENATTDNGTSIIPDIVSTRWNPLMSIGEKIQFGYIDIYYYIASVDSDDPVQVTLNFYTDNSDNWAAQRTLTLDGPTNSEYTFKRVYLNCIGEFIQMEIDPTVDSFMQFLGFIVWVRPAGRLTP